MRACVRCGREEAATVSLVAWETLVEKLARSSPLADFKEAFDMKGKQAVTAYRIDTRAYGSNES